MARLSFRIIPAVAFFVPAALAGQGRHEPGGLPEWLFADSILVQEPSWITATVAKNIVVLSFRPGTTAERRTAIVRRVHGVVVYDDSTSGRNGAYFVKVATHPDACGVKQALAILDRLPEVQRAAPHMVSTSTADGGLPNVPATHKGSKRPCPPGTGLLR
jgi:hypothetical protein